MGACFNRQGRPIHSLVRQESKLMRKTDVIKFPWPESWHRSNHVANRRICRRFYEEYKWFPELFNQQIIVGYSGGIDSTVLTHCLWASSLMYTGKPPMAKLVYINHQLRSNIDIQKDKFQMFTLAASLGMDAMSIQISCEHNQESAREERYKALANEIVQFPDAVGLLGHNANDIVETKLFQFLTGRRVVGISRSACINFATFYRPLLLFTRDEIAQYAQLWNLQWSEDCTNATNDYTRNRIRHDLIPWIEQNVNKGIVKMLANT